MEKFLKSRTIQTSLIGVIALLVTTLISVLLTDNKLGIRQNGMINTVGQTGGTNVVNLPDDVAEYSLMATFSLKGVPFEASPPITFHTRI